MEDPYIIAISLAAGLIAAGFVWFLWDFAEKIYEVIEARRMQRKLKKDAEALLDQAGPAPDAAGRKG